jgi:hypothetical protein
MFAAALLCNAVLWIMPLSEAAAAGPTVTAREIFDVRHVRLGAKPDSAGPRFSMERPGMRLVVELRGEDVAHASHYGMLELEAAADDKGGTLKLNEDALGFHDLRKEFVEIDRSQMFLGEDNPPKDAIRVEIPFESPARAASAVSVRGKLQLRRVETVDVLVPATPGEVKHEQLEKLGVKLTIVKPEEDNGFAYEAEGKLDALLDAQLVDAQGKPLETNGSMSMGGGESLHREIMLGKPLPAGAKVKLVLVVKSANVPVPLDLKDVKLP